MDGGQELPRVSYAANMLLASVVDTSRRVADTTKRLEKIYLLARLIRQLNPQEIEIVVPFLSGQTRQGRIGIGYAALRDVSNSPAASPSLEILEVDRILQNITETSGSGSQRRRLELLADARRSAGRRSRAWRAPRRRGGLCVRQSWWLLSRGSRRVG